MGVFSSGGVGLDPGSANVTLCLENEGVVLREPSYVLALRDDPEEILAVGRDARQMIGRTPRDVVLHSPIMDGAVGNVDMAAALLGTLCEKALGKRRALDRNRLAVSVSEGATQVELEAMERVVRQLGAKKACLLRSTVACALGAGLSIEEARGIMVVLIGGSTTEIAVLSMNGIAAARSTRTGSLSFDEAIMRCVRREKGLIIGQRTAEDLKIDLGTAQENALLDNEVAQLRGRDARSGRPATVEVSAKDIRQALIPPMEALLESIREAFENTPADMAEDILERGIYLSGGGSLLDGLGERLEKMLSVRVARGETPQDEVARGLCMAASDARLAQRIAASGCLIEL